MTEVFCGYLNTLGGEAIHFAFAVPAGATEQERNAAAFVALMEQMNDDRRTFEPAMGLVSVGIVE